MDAAELLDRYAAGRRVFRAAYLRGIDLSEASLSHVDFCDADLRQANLAGADLSRAQSTLTPQQFAEMFVDKNLMK
jgi:uncharacterized protein YjbI with pentapeptide repeats